MEAAEAEPPILFDMAIKVVGRILADSHPAKLDQLPWPNRFKLNPSVNVPEGKWLQKL